MDHRVEVALQALQESLAKQSEALSPVEDSLNLLTAVPDSVGNLIDVDHPDFSLPKVLMSMASLLDANTRRMKSVVRKMEAARAKRA